MGFSREHGNCLVISAPARNRIGHVFARHPFDYGDYYARVVIAIYAKIGACRDNGLGRMHCPAECSIAWLHSFGGRKIRFMTCRYAKHIAVARMFVDVLTQGKTIPLLISKQI